MQGQQVHRTALSANQRTSVIHQLPLEDRRAALTRIPQPCPLLARQRVEKIAGPGTSLRWHRSMLRLVLGQHLRDSRAPGCQGRLPISRGPRGSSQPRGDRHTLSRS